MESKVLLLGGSGVVGSFLKTALHKEYELYAPTSTELNLLDTDAVKYFFRNNYFDVVVNCAGNTDSRLVPFNHRVFEDNITMFNNVWREVNHYGRLINFGSGGEFDRRQDISNAGEETLFLRTPTDHYGMSKNTISRIVFDTDNCYTLRLFGLFGPNEPKYRLLKKILSGEPVLLEDKYFDYYYIEDILPVVRYYIDSEKPKYKDLNVVYPTKILLSYFVEQFCQLHKLDSQNIKLSSHLGLNYTGNSVKIEELKLNLLGYKIGLERYK